MLIAREQLAHALQRAGSSNLALGYYKLVYESRVKLYGERDPRTVGLKSFISQIFNGKTEIR